MCSLHPSSWALPVHGDPGRCPFAAERLCRGATPEERIMFVIKSLNGMPIEGFSDFPQEQEVLLFPGSEGPGCVDCSCSEVC